MSLDKEKIELEARMFALETMLCHWIATQFAATPDGSALFQRYSAAMLQNADVFAVPGLRSPELSDHVAGEIRNSLERLLGVQATFLERLRAASDNPQS